jgi:hypothetical protein
MIQKREAKLRRFKMEKKKIKLHAIGNQKTYNYYIFDKKQEVIEILNKLVWKIFKLDLGLYEEYNNKTGKWKRKKINTETQKDIHKTIGNEPRIDIFYGDKKMYLTINSPWGLRLKFNNELFKIGSMPKEKKLKKFQIKQ